MFVTKEELVEHYRIAERHTDAFYFSSALPCIGAELGGGFTRIGSISF